MEKQNNITYFLGAGASYHSVPITEEFNYVLERFKRAVQKLSDENPNLKEPGQAMYNYIDAYRRADEFHTIDTYAKKLWLQKNATELSKLKTTISLFLAIWQQMVDKDQLFKEKVAGIGDENGQMKKYKNNYDDIDKRYITLLSSFLKRKFDKIVLDDNINFISWNYDVQLEMALQKFTDKNIDSIIDDYAVFPNINGTRNPGPYRIVHLNGIAGLYETTKDNKRHTLFNRSTIQNSSLSELIELAYVFDSTRHGDISNNRFFSYAWEALDNNDRTGKEIEEESKIARKAVEEASRIMAETNVLVIIGYSFPAFNKDVDKELFTHLVKNGKLKMVYYQAPNANIKLLKNRFNIPHDKISPVEDVSQFEIPLHYL